MKQQASCNWVTIYSGPNESISKWTQNRILRPLNALVSKHFFFKGVKFYLFIYIIEMRLRYSIMLVSGALHSDLTFTYTMK